MADPKGFLQAMRVEAANFGSAMSTVTFLVEMTLVKLMELNRLIRLQDRKDISVKDFRIRGAPKKGAKNQLRKTVKFRSKQQRIGVA